MPKRNYEIKSIFNKWLGREARRLASEGKIKIIETKDFPEGAPLHEDGGSVYDPMKPLVLFAIELNGIRAIKAWNEVEREFNRLIAA